MKTSSRRSVFKPLIATIFSTIVVLAGCGGGGSSSSETPAPTPAPPPATPTLVSIAVTPPTASVAAGNTQQLTATGTYSDATTKNLTTQVAWTSATPPS